MGMRKLPYAVKPPAHKTVGVLGRPRLMRRNRSGKMCRVVQCSFEKKMKLHRLAAKAARKIFMGIFYVLGSAPLYNKKEKQQVNKWRNV